MTGNSYERDGCNYIERLEITPHQIGLSPARFAAIYGEKCESLFIDIPRDRKFCKSYMGYAMTTTAGKVGVNHAVWGETKRGELVLTYYERVDEQNRFVVGWVEYTNRRGLIVELDFSTNKDALLVLLKECEVIY